MKYLRKANGPCLTHKGSVKCHNIENEDGTKIEERRVFCFVFVSSSLFIGLLVDDT